MKIEQRLSKLERLERDIPDRRPGVDPEAMEEIRKVAGVVSSPDDLARFLESREEPATGGVVSLDEKRRNDAVRSAFARSMFDKGRDG